MQRIQDYAAGIEALRRQQRDNSAMSCSRSIKPEVLIDTGNVGDFVKQAVEAYIKAQGG